MAQQAAHDPFTRAAADAATQSLADAAAERAASGDLGPAIGNAAGQLGIAWGLGRVGAGGAPESPLAGSIRNVNPTGSMQNCVSCAIATDATLSGRPASAIPGGPWPAGNVFGFYPGRVFIPANGYGGIRTMMTNAGPGARGIVWGTRTGQQGHMFNVVNQGGTIRFLDGQTGGAAVLENYDNLYLLRTN